MNASQADANNTEKNDKECLDLVFGIISSVGVNLDLVVKTLEKNMRCIGYLPQEIHLSDFLDDIMGLEVKPIDTPECERIRTHMDAGDELRRKCKDGSVLAQSAISEICRYRKEKQDKYAFILTTLKHKDEIKKLRDVYRKNFWLISVYSTEEKRRERLTDKSRQENPTSWDKHAACIDEIIDRDKNEQIKFGQDVQGAFPEGDVFIYADEEKHIESPLRRFIDLIFGYTFHTPNREECGMFYAYASSLRSASLSRQVGASITDDDGEILATGTNEVPKAGGGSYWPGDEPDWREWKLKRDSNDKYKQEILLDVIDKIRGGNTEQASRSNHDILKQLQNPENAPKLMNIIEFSREVHAEMSALIDASRKTISVMNSTMYVTTFPCHICAKHIVASGIKTVIYIESYPKSVANELFKDSISFSEKPNDNRVFFKRFIGISPKRFIDLFQMNERKDKSGQKTDPLEDPKIRYYSKYINELEKKELENLGKMLENAKIQRCS